jgi:hypothetical protein
VVFSTTPVIPRMLPIMSLLITASSRIPCCFAHRATIPPPNSPCSSPESAA